MIHTVLAYAEVQLNATVLAACVDEDRKRIIVLSRNNQSKELMCHCHSTDPDATPGFYWGGYGECSARQSWEERTSHLLCPVDGVKATPA